MKELVYKLPQNFKHIFIRHNILWHVFMIFSTYAIASSGFDWAYFTHTRGLLLNEILLPAIVIGAFLPILGPLALLGIGKILKNRRFVLAAWAVTQAQGLGLFISSLYKAFTGRLPPALANTSIDISEKFRFGFLQGGVFWGWPSSHTTVAFAMAATIAMLFPKNTYVKILAFAYALYIGLGVSISIHWFSDFVAGIILGSLIGSVVGKSFSEHGVFVQQKNARAT